MNRVDFIFDNTTHYALYEIVHLDGLVEYYLEFRDRPLISEFGLALQFKRDSEGRPQLPGDTSLRTKALIETILLSIEHAALPPEKNK